jgi:hypothetical protein
MPKSTTYRFCTSDEVQERQELGQVSALEATLETCHLPQAQRILDPNLAMTMYRRSAAGAEMQAPRSAEKLRNCLHHLICIGATFQATPRHPRVDSVDTVVNFVVDRLRACQSDATRLMVRRDHDSLLPAVWHVQAIRLLIWMQYVWSQNFASNTDSLLPRTIHTIRSTAYDAYWSVREAEAASMIDMDMEAYALDDEMLCYAAMSRICSTSSTMMESQPPSSLETSWSGMLLEFTKRQQTTMPSLSSFSYPLWKQALQVAALASRQEFHMLLVSNEKSFSSLPILARCILSSMRFSWMYRTVQCYNVSFAKSEAVSDMDRLLGIAAEHWSTNHADLFGAPVSTLFVEGNDFDGPMTISMIMKQEIISNLDGGRIKQRNTLENVIKDDQQWVFRSNFDAEQPWGISGQKVHRVLHSGVSLTKQEHTMHTNDKAMVVKHAPMSSLAAALCKIHPVNCFDPVKKAPAKCKFHAKGSCRNGDKCRFVHS